MVSIAWINKGEAFPLVVLKNGTRIHFFPSGGVPGMGDPVDILFIDEDVPCRSTFPGIGRLLTPARGRHRMAGGSRGGSSGLRGRIATTTPQTCVGSPGRGSQRRPECVRDHPEVPREPVYLGQAQGPDDQVLRNMDRRGPRLGFGRFLDNSVLWYPNFNIETHGIPAGGSKHPETALADGAGKIPKTWTNHLGLDRTYASKPGRAQCATSAGWRLLLAEICHEGASVHHKG